MREDDWVRLIALSGWLVLALSAYRARQLNAKKAIVMALAWGAIFLLVTGVFVAIGH